MLATLGQYGITGNGVAIPSGTPYSSYTPINVLIAGLIHGPSTLGGATTPTQASPGAQDPTTRVCLDLPNALIASLPIPAIPGLNLSATCDNPQSQTPTTTPVPAGFDSGAGGSIVFASWLGA